MDVSDWLRKLGLERYEAAFSDNEIDWEALPKLTAEDLKDLGVVLGSHRRKLLEAIGALHGKTDAAAERRLPVPAAAERRQLTVMFCDLVGSTELSSRLDPEDLREVIAAYHRAVADVVRSFDGFVAKYMGDGVLTYFGYPMAHEDDAERAVRAGLGVIDAVARLDVNSVGLQARVGIATGLVVVGDLIGEGSSQEQSVVGETPNLAARLQALAEPHAVVIAAGTRRLVGDLFEYRDLGAIEVKGIAEPVTAGQVLRASVVASRFEALRGSALAPLVARDEEIDLLLRRWARARAGNGQVVLISGEPGLGKSRITVELAERLHGEPYIRQRCFCSPYRQDSALYPFIDQLGRAAGLTPADPPATKLTKLEALLARASTSEEDVAFLADLLSLPTPGHHLPPNLSSLRDLPALLIVTFRPEFQPSWIGQAHVTMLVLNRLDLRDRAALIKQIAGRKSLPDDVSGEIVERTDGVPLFIEELTKSVLESGVPLVGIPTSLHASLMARLDRLASARHVAQIGAAFGRWFRYTLLRAVAGLPDDELQASLARLVASELVFQSGIPPDAVYTFKHALVQEAAYGTLLRNARQQLHGRIAEALESHFPDLMENQPELFARHYTEAGLFEKTITYWGKAGHRSAARSAMAEAAAQFQKGLDQLLLVPDTPERRRQELEFLSALGAAWRAVKGQAASESGHAYARARELWEQLGCPAEFLQVPYGQSRYHLYRGELDLAQRLNGDLLRLSRQRGDSGGLVLGHDSAGRNLMSAGKFALSRSHLGEVLALYDPISHRSLVQQAGIHPQVGSQVFLGIVLFCLGFPDQALSQSSAAIAEARRLAHPPTLAGCLAVGVRLLSLVGDDTALSEWTDQLVAVATEQGFTFWRAQGTICCGWVRIKNGDVAEGISLLRSGSAAYRATGSELLVPHYIALLAQACEGAGQIEEAVTLLDEALEIVGRTGECWLEADLHRHKGQLLLRQGHSDAAEELFCKALSVAREQEAKLWELRAAI